MGGNILDVVKLGRPDLLLLYLGVPSKAYSERLYENPLPSSGKKLVIRVLTKKIATDPGNPVLNILGSKTGILEVAYRLLRDAGYLSPVTLVEYTLHFEISENGRAVARASGTGYVGSIYVDATPWDKIGGLENIDIAEKICRDLLNRIEKTAPDLMKYTRAKVKEIDLVRTKLYRPILLIRIPRPTKQLHQALADIKRLIT